MDECGMESERGTIIACGQQGSAAPPHQIFSEMNIKLSSDDSITSTTDESIDNREISNSEVGVTTPGELRQVNLVTQQPTKWDKTRFKL